MGDMVHFATTDAGANSSAFNGFPFAVPFGKQWEGEWTLMQWTDPVTQTYSGRQTIAGWYETVSPTDTTPLATQPTVTLPDPSELEGSVGIFIPSSRPMFGDGTEYFGPMTHTEAVAMYWRVQVWDLTVSGSGASAIGHLHTVDDGSYDFSVTDLNDDSTYCTVPNDVRERDLTLSGFRGFNHKGKLYGVQTLPGDPYPDYPFVANAHVTVGGPTVGVGMKVICDIDSPLDYYVSFGDITASSGASYWDQYSGASASLSTCIFLVAQPPYSLYEHYDWSEFYYPTTTMKSGPDGSIPLNITLPGGRNISSNCELYQNLSSVYYGDSTSQLSAGSITSLTLAPSKYWPYSNQPKTAPIWDTVTGAQINPIT